MDRRGALKASLGALFCAGVAAVTKAKAKTKATKAEEKPLSKIRLWKLGDLEHGIYPTDQAFRTLSEALQGANEKDGTLDIIWGPDLSVEVVEGSNDVIRTLEADGEYHYRLVAKKKEPMLTGLEMRLLDANDDIIASKEVGMNTREVTFTTDKEVTVHNIVVYIPGLGYSTPLQGAGTPISLKKKESLTVLCDDNGLLTIGE